MAISNIAAAADTNATNAASKNTAVSIADATKDLGKDAFLKLLIAELSNQDPLNPMDDREFITQMAQFSELEQMQNMNSTLESLLGSNKFDAVNYIGKAVSFMQKVTDKDGNTESQQVAGIVQAVWFDGSGEAILDTSLGEVALSDVVGVFDPALALGSGASGSSNS